MTKDETKASVKQAIKASVADFKKSLRKTLRDMANEDGTSEEHYDFITGCAVEVAICSEQLQLDIVYHEDKGWLQDHGNELSYDESIAGR